MSCFEGLVAKEACKEKEDWMKRTILLSTAALLAMLILTPMVLAQGMTIQFDETVFSGGTMFGTFGPPVPVANGGGPAILLPAAALLLGSGILTYAVLRRRW